MEQTSRETPKNELKNHTDTFQFLNIPIFELTFISPNSNLSHCARVPFIQNKIEELVPTNGCLLKIRLATDFKSVL